MIRREKQSGFTFIELLVVVTIIAVLTAVAMVSYVSTNKKSRDTKRKADLQEMRSALEIVRAECGSYPSGDIYNLGIVCDAVTYMAAAKMPVDPRSSAIYDYSSDGVSYQLCASEMENEGQFCVENP